MVLTLFKLRMRQLLAGMVTSKKAGKTVGKGGKIALAALYVFLIIYFACMVGALCASLCLAFGETDFAWLYFAFTSAMAFMLCFVGSVFAATNYLYKAKDNELLLSMPVKPGAILLSRMLMLLVENYGFAFIVLIPAGIVWGVMQSFTVGGLVCFILGTLLLPLLSLTVSCIFGWIIMTVSSKVRNKKIITLVFAVALFAAYMWFCSQITTVMEKLIMNGAAMAAVFEKYLFPFYHFGKAALSGNFVSFILFVLCAVVPFAAAYFILEKNYIRIMTANKGEKKRRYKAGEAKSAGVKTALVKKEIGRFTSSAMYILIASMGVVMMVLLSVVLLVKKADLFVVLDVFPEADGVIPAAVSALLCFCASMVTISAPSVSVEGKNLWLVKSLPVSGFDILDAKALCHVVVTVPFAVIAGIISAIALKANIWQSVQLITLPAAACVFCAYFGVTVNMKFPKFDWVSEIHCIKQSGSVAISMFGMMGIVGVMVLVYAVGLSRVMSADMCVLLYTALLLALGFLLRQRLKKSGSRAFEQLQG
ncbi:MAG: hypothetical protein IJC91_02160 [Oscillospiraceae bacterium]|nr:hypothetical protein [Oscillospiraceae bacterium]